PRLRRHRRPARLEPRGLRPASPDRRAGLSTMPPAKVSGIGAVCHAGSTAAEVGDGMTDAVVAPVEIGDARLAGPVGRIDLGAGSTSGRDRSFDGPGRSRAGRLAVRAAAEAVRGAGPGPRPGRTGLVVGSCMGNSGESERGREGAA